jgi:hypothetical protein
MTSCEDFSEPLQQERGPHTSSSLHLRGELPGRESGPVHKVPSPRRHSRLERMSNPYGCVRNVTYRSSATYIHCVTNHRWKRMREAVTHTVSYFGRLSYNFGATEARTLGRLQHRCSLFPRSSKVLIRTTNLQPNSYRDRL